MSSKIVLASTSKYRKELLSRLGISFSQESPEVDETPENNEAPSNLAVRLARKKAKAIADKHDSGIIIGSDQVAAVDGRILKKPLEMEKAVKQLLSLSGKEVYFLTAVCVHNIDQDQTQVELDEVIVTFRTLDEDDVRRYLDKEPAFDCVGAFKSEGLGISLCDKVVSHDPTSLIGLPLVRVSRMLRAAGVLIP